MKRRIGPSQLNPETLGAQAEREEDAITELESSSQSVAPRYDIVFTATMRRAHVLAGLIIGVLMAVFGCPAFFCS